MNILICGAGRIGELLIKRLGVAWRMTLIDKDADRLDRLSKEFEWMARIIKGDASSPVVLEEADLAGQSYVLALTGDDRVNLAVARFARKAGVSHIVALVYLAEYLPNFEELEVKTINVTQSVSNLIHGYLQDPRITITPVAHGSAELLEIEIGSQFELIGRPLNRVRHPNWKVVGLLRQDNLVDSHPDTVLQRGDRLLILGRSNVFRDVCSLAECATPNFPRIYGTSLSLGLLGDKPADCAKLLAESFYLVQNIKLQQMTAICSSASCAQQVSQVQVPDGIQLDVQEPGTKLIPAIRRHCRETNVGIAVVPLLGKAIFEVLAKPLHVDLAHNLPCPLMVAKGSHPYKRILIPFNGSPASVTALEAALDIALQLDAEATVAIVKEPDFLHGTEEEGPWAVGLIVQAREVALSYKRAVSEVIRTGNPVAEIAAMAGDFDLIVIGSPTDEKGFLEPHVGELLVRKSPCSALIITH